MKRRIFSIAMALCLLLSMLPQTAWAEDMPAPTEPTISAPIEETEPVPGKTIQESGACGNNLTWVLDSEGTMTISGTGEMWEYDYGPPAWYGDNRIRTLVIEEGVTSITGGTFGYCTNLTNIVLPDSLTAIGGGAFSNCTGLISITIPENVTQIGRAPFDGCEQLTRIEVDADNPAYCTDSDSVLFNKDKTQLIQAPGAITGSYQIPDTVVTIGDYAFYGCTGLTDITVPDGVTNIGGYAFVLCSGLTAITVPDSVNNIGPNAFGGCSSLVYNSYENGKYLGNESNPYAALMKIASSTVESCEVHWATKVIAAEICGYNYALTSIVIPDSVTAVSSYAFYDCSNLKEIWFCGNIPYIGSYAFSDTTATAYYPGFNITWTEEVMQDYGGNITWVTYSNDPEIVDSGTCGDNLIWTLDRDGNLYISGSGEMKNYTNETAVPWYSYRASIENVVIEDGVTCIGKYAFSEYYNLTSITIPASITKVDYCAFYSCGNLKNVYINDISAWCNIYFVSGSTPLYYGGNLYLNEKLVMDLVIPHGIERVESYAFAGCQSLVNVTIPDTVTYIDSDAFYGCDNLMNVSIPSSVIFIDRYAFSGCENLTSVLIPDSVTTIADYAFQYSGLTNIMIPASVTQIGLDAFDCQNLTGIWVDENNQVYSSDNRGVLFNKEKNQLIEAPGAISGSYTIPDGVLSIRESAFSECLNLISVTIPYGITHLSENMFQFCSNLTSVSIPNSVTDIERRVFYCCYSLTDIEIPDSVTAIGDSAFSFCNSLNYHIYGNAKYLGSESNPYLALIECVDTSISRCTIHENTKILCGSSFQHCSDLTEITIPGDVSQIDSYTFFRCTGLKNVTIENGVTVIGDYAFLNCSNLTSITIPNSVTYIGDSSFSNCYSLTDLKIPDSVIRIGNNAFYNCRNLVNLIIPDSVTAIHNFAFLGCSSLLNIEIGNGVISIGKEAFSGCSSLTSISIGNNISSIGEGAFNQCTQLTKVNISNLQSWCSVSFDGNTSNPLSYAKKLYLNGTLVTDLVIPEGVSEICRYAFYNCNNITSLTIPNSVTDISTNSFYYCTSLNEITFLGDAHYITYNAFEGITATAYYPAGNSTWNFDVLRDYGGTITWIAISFNAVSIYENGIEKQSYESLADALADYTGSNQYIQLTSDLSVDFTLTSDLYIDLNGYNLSGVITLNGYQVYGMDSTTDNYSCDSIGYFNCVDEMGETVVPEVHWRSDVTGSVKRYLCVENDGKYSFHRFYMGITHTSIKPGADSVGYKAVFAGDEMVRNYIDTYGYSIRLGTNTPIKTEKTGTQMQSGKAVTLRIDGYDVENYGEEKLTARVFITVNGETIYSTSYTSSPRDMVERINEQAATLTAPQLAVLKEMLERHSIMQSWKVENLL